MQMRSGMFDGAISAVPEPCSPVVGRSPTFAFWRKVGYQAYTKICIYLIVCSLTAAVDYITATLEKDDGRVAVM